MFSLVQNKVKECLETIVNESHNPVTIQPVPGGSINEVYSFCYGKKKYFIKINEAKAYPHMFEKEAAGLTLLQQPELHVPEVILLSETNAKQFIVLSYLEKVNPDGQYWQQLGRGLAGLHKLSSDLFGLDHDNYIGSLVQLNRQQKSFTDFFITQRIEPLISKAIHEKKYDKGIIRNIDRLFNRLDDIIPPEKPALLHGDLWSGNVMASAGGPALFDPAVYYGHREADLAMTHLFGGFHPTFYESYFNEFPLEKGWQERTELFNLYPLLVHVNLFGSGYIRDVKTIISRF